MTSSSRSPLAAHEFIEVLNLLALYGEIFDGRRWDDLDQVFTEDCIVDYSSSGRGEQRGIRALRRHMIDNPPLVLSHMFTNPRGYEQGGTVHVHCTLLAPQPTGAPWTGTYDDELVRTDQGLRICKRIVRMRRELGDA